MESLFILCAAVAAVFVPLVAAETVWRLWQRRMTPQEKAIRGLKPLSNGRRGR